MALRQKGLTVAGWVLTALVALMMGFGATMALTKAPGVADHLVGQFGYPADVIVPIGIAQLCCAILFVIPRTAVLGAILLTGYLGGAVATHVRIHDNFVGAVVFGILIWIALLLREPRLRALLPLRRPG